MHAITTSSKKSKDEPILTDAELMAISEELSSYFPKPIAETLITLMEVDPYTIHAYWNIEPSRMEKIRYTVGNGGREGALTLRVHTKRLGAKNCVNGFFDCAIQGMQSSTYINVLPQAPYVAEIGLLRPDGDFLALALSNEVMTPPDYQTLRRPAHNDRQENAAPAKKTTQPPVTLMSDKFSETSLARLDEMDVATPLSVSPVKRGRESIDKGIFYTGSERSQEQFDIHVEFRAFGRVDPVKGLTIAGESVAIRPDGSFNHRIPVKSKENMMSLLKIELDETIDE